MRKFSHDDVKVSVEDGAWGTFCQCICNVLSCFNVFHRDEVAVDPVLYGKVADVNVACVLCRLLGDCHAEGTHVVAEDKSRL